MEGKQQRLTLLVTLGLLGIVGSAMAANYTPTYGEVGTNSVAIGEDASASKNKAVAIGDKAIAGQNNAVAIGYNAKATGMNPLAVGTSSVAQGNNSTAIGEDAKAYGTGNTVVGTQAGYYMMDNGANPNKSGTAYENISVLGTMAQVTSELSFKKFNDEPITYTLGEDGSVSLEGTKYTRMENTSQKAGQNQIAVGYQAYAFTSHMGEESPSVSKTIGNAISIGGSSQVKGAGATTIGTMSAVTGDKSVAVGMGANITNAKESTALGTYASITSDSAVALGAKAQAKAVGAVAIGADSIADMANTVSVGNTNKQRRIVHVAEGVDATDAVTVSQLNALETKVTTLSNNAPTITSALHSVKETAEANKVAVANASTAIEKVKASVETLGTDVVAAKTAASTAQESANNAKTLADTASTKAEAAAQGVTTLKGTVDTLTEKVEKTSSDITAVTTGLHALTEEVKGMSQGGGFDATPLQEGIAKNKEEIRRTGALVSALAGLKPMPFEKGDSFQFMAGIGRYKGATSIATGVAYRVNENGMINLGLAFGHGQSTALSGGVSVKFGPKRQVPATENTRGEVEALSREVERLEGEVQTLKKQYEEVLALLKKP